MQPLRRAFHEGGSATIRFVVRVLGDHATIGASVAIRDRKGHPVRIAFRVQHGVFARVPWVGDRPHDRKLVQCASLTVGKREIRVIVDRVRIFARACQDGSTSQSDVFSFNSPEVVFGDCMIELSRLCTYFFG